MATTPEASAAVEYNTGYLRTPAGILRLLEGVIGLGGIISCAEGAVCDFDSGKYGLFILVCVVSLIHSILVLVVIVLKLEKRITVINVPLTLLLNDSIRILFYFIACILIMLSIGRCHYMMAARIVATLFGIGGFLVLVGLSYTDYKWWRGEQTPYDSETTNSANGMPVTASSPTVLTLS